MLRKAPITAKDEPKPMSIFGLTFNEAIIGFIIISPTVIIGITVTVSAYVREI